MEISPRGSSYLHPDSSGILVHTNHFIENRCVEEVPWQIASVPRLERIKELVRQIRTDYQKVDKITPSVLRERIFSDKDGAPTAICCYVFDRNNPKAAVSTLFNIVMIFSPGESPRAEVRFIDYEDVWEKDIYQLPW